MCAEKDPLMCHRTMLVCRDTAERSTFHWIISLADGSIERMPNWKKGCSRLLNIPQDDLFTGTTNSSIQLRRHMQSDNMPMLPNSNDFGDARPWFSTKTPGRVAWLFIVWSRSSRTPAMQSYGDVLLDMSDESRSSRRMRPPAG